MNGRMEKIKITAFPRVHITLIGMGNGIRINGGVGFSISDPKIHLEILKSKSTNTIIDKRLEQLNKSENESLIRKLNAICIKYNFQNTLSGKIISKALPHSGLGTGTIITLGFIEGLFLLNNEPYSEDLIIYLSKRGSTSGIGINTYFKGGFVCDLGKKEP